jgi:hypothetical protein
MLAVYYRRGAFGERKGIAGLGWAAVQAALYSSAYISAPTLLADTAVSFFFSSLIPAASLRNT